MIRMIGGWGGSPTGKSFRFVRASGRGEAKLRERAGGDVLCVARAPAGAVKPSTARPAAPGWVVPPVVPWDASCQCRAG